MNVLEYVHDTIAASTLLDAMIGDRVYVQVAPDRVVAPYIVLTLVDETYENTLSGRQGTARARVQVDVFARTYYDADSIALTTQDCIEAEGNFTKRPIIASRRDTFESDTKLHRVSSDVILWHVLNVTSP